MITFILLVMFIIIFAVTRIGAEPADIPARLIPPDIEIRETYIADLAPEIKDNIAESSIHVLEGAPARMHKPAPAVIESAPASVKKIADVNKPAPADMNKPAPAVIEIAPVDMNKSASPDMNKPASPDMNKTAPAVIEIAPADAKKKRVRFSKRTRRRDYDKLTGEILADKVYNHNAGILRQQ